MLVSSFKKRVISILMMKLVLTEHDTERRQILEQFLSDYPLYEQDIMQTWYDFQEILNDEDSRILEAEFIY